MAHDVFISHSTKDKAISDAVCAGLESAGIRCWIAPRDVQPGRSFAGEINRAIQRSKVMVLIFSAHSNNSEQVLREVQLAVNSHLHILQFRIEDVRLNDDLEYFLSTPHWLDALSPPLEDHIDRLRSSIRGLLQATGQETEDVSLPPSRPPVREIAAPAVPQKRPARSRKWLWIAAGLAIAIACVLALIWNSGLSPKRETRTEPVPQSPTPQNTISASPKAVSPVPESKTAANVIPTPTPDGVGPTLLSFGTGYKVQDGKPVPEHYGFTDVHGHVVIQPEWDYAGEFHFGIATVSRNGKAGAIDKTGHLLIDLQWDGLGNFTSNGVAFVIRDKKWGLINKSGRVIMEPQWDVGGFTPAGVAFVIRDKKWGLIDKSGHVVIQPEWESLYDEGGVFHVTKDGKAGFFDVTGKMIVPPGQWKSVRYFREGLCPVAEIADDNYVWGFIDISGKVTLPVHWYLVGDFSEGVAPVTRRVSSGFYETGFIDKMGNVVIDYQRHPLDSFGDGLAGIEIKNKHGFIDRTGKIVIQPVWDYVYKFEHDLCVVGRGEGDKRKVGVIDKIGAIVIQPEWKSASVYGLVIVSNENKKMGLFNKAGQSVTPCEWDDLQPVWGERSLVEPADPQGETPEFYHCWRRAPELVEAWFDAQGKKIWSSDQQR